MARRAPLDEKPFRPLNAAVLSSVLQHVPRAEPTTTVVEMVSPKLEVPPAARPTAPASPVERAVPVVKRLDQEKRILYSRDEVHALDRLVQGLAIRLHAQVKASHVMRALTLLLVDAEREVHRRAEDHGAMVRPPNGDMAALQRFERRLADLLAEGLRRG
jgi:hypothetical protein